MANVKIKEGGPGSGRRPEGGQGYGGELSGNQRVYIRDTAKWLMGKGDNITATGLKKLLKGEKLNPIEINHVKDMAQYDIGKGNGEIATLLKTNGIGLESHSEAFQMTIDEMKASIAAEKDLAKKKALMEKLAVMMKQGEESFAAKEGGPGSGRRPEGGSNAPDSENVKFVRASLKDLEREYDDLFEQKDNVEGDKRARLDRKLDKIVKDMGMLNNKLVNLRITGESYSAGKYSFTEAFDAQVEESDIAANPLRRRAVFVSEGYTRNKARFYTKEALKAGAKHFEGAKMFFNHQTATEAGQRPERSVEDDVAVMKNVAYEERNGIGKVVGDIDIYGSPTVEAAKIASWIDNKKKAGAPVELSLHGYLEAEPEQRESRTVNVIKAISRISSVDFVTTANAGGVVESFDNLEEFEGGPGSGRRPEGKSAGDDIEGNLRDKAARGDAQAEKDLKTLYASRGVGYTRGRFTQAPYMKGLHTDIDGEEIDTRDTVELVNSGETGRVIHQSGDGLTVATDTGKTVTVSVKRGGGKMLKLLKKYESLSTLTDVRKAVDEAATLEEKRDIIESFFGVNEGGPGSGRRPEGGGKNDFDDGDGTGLNWKGEKLTRLNSVGTKVRIRGGGPKAFGKVAGLAPDGKVTVRFLNSSDRVSVYPEELISVERAK